MTSEQLNVAGKKQDNNNRNRNRKNCFGADHLNIYHRLDSIHGQFGIYFLIFGLFICLLVDFGFLFHAFLGLYTKAVSFSFSQRVSTIFCSAGLVSVVLVFGLAEDVPPDQGNRL